MAKRIIGLLILILASQAQADWLYATPINPEAFRIRFESAKKDADVVAEVRVLTIVCTEAKKEGNEVRSVTLQVAMQVLAVEKGTVKKNEIVAVAREVQLPAGPGPRSYGYMGALRQFPFTPGVKGNVALRWDKEGRRYVGIAGWVPEPNNAEIPKEVGKSVSVRDLP